MDSILTTIKKMLGISEEDEHFDPDLIIHINSILSILSQIGVGPIEGFSIINKDAIWLDFLPENSNLELVKSYISLRVRLIFDTPTSSSLIDSIKRIIDELEWRILLITDVPTI